MLSELIFNLVKVDVYFDMLVYMLDGWKYLVLRNIIMVGL